LGLQYLCCNFRRIYTAYGKFQNIASGNSALHGRAACGGQAEAPPEIKDTPFATIKPTCCFGRRTRRALEGKPRSVPDYYHIPALVLTELLLPAFGYLYLRFRDARTLLWFLGFFFAVISMVSVHFEGAWLFASSTHPWMVAGGQVAIQISTALNGIMLNK